MRETGIPAPELEKTAAQHGGVASIFGWPSFECWGDGIPVSHMFPEQFSKLSLIAARDNR